MSTSTTDEYADTVSHTCAGFGNYQVLLIAHGCNGKADTVSFHVKSALHADPTVITDGQGYFLLFPNPLPSGSPINVYINGLNPEHGDVILKFHDMRGREVHQVQLSATEGSYQLNPKLSQEMYNVSLFQGETLLQTRKLNVL